MRRLSVLVALALAAVVVAASPASAYTFSRSLKEDDSGRDVKVLQIRMAGWYPRDDQSQLALDGTYGSATTDAVKAFQAFYGLEPDGVAGPATFAIIDGLEDDNGSTLHFDWREFKQKSNSRCSAKANAYAGTFGGGMVAPKRAKKNVKKLMWRLEALRAKAGDKPVGVNSAFRSTSYNDCIGGAGLSQHMYGTAVDNRMAEVTNRTERDLAKSTRWCAAWSWNPPSTGCRHRRGRAPPCPGRATTSSGHRRGRGCRAAGRSGCGSWMSSSRSRGTGSPWRGRARSDW